MPVTHADHVAHLVSLVRPDLEPLAARTCARIEAEMAVYGTVVPTDRLRASVEANLAAALDSLTGNSDLTHARTTARERAEQGAPLPEVLRAFRIGFTVIWDRLVELAGDDPTALRTVVGAASAMWHLFDAFSEAVTSEYREAGAELLLLRQKQRSALVEALFAGSTDASLWDIARLLELPLDGTFAVVAAEVTGLGQEPLPRVEARLRDAHLASAWRLTPDLQVGVVSLHGPLGPVLDVLRTGLSARVGLSPVYTGLAGTPQALHFARVALASLPRGAAQVAQFDQSPLAGLVADSPETSAQLARQVLGPVLALDDRDVLLTTLHTWYACGGSTRLTAERLYCHPNTVRHRLRRVTDALHRSLTDPADITELGTALRALMMFPDTAQPG
ncbi:PucR family transcriptional regulator [Actinokineospora soli]|uniref:PucR family transcriptional regulator n=1 Tax=Actinokineospora soli TaxID=1048753 RepID=A0ABW2TUK3_9PSEU